MSIAPPTSDDNKEESVPLNPVDLDESDDDENADIPDEFLCPVTREVMVNPVVTLAGHTYEREAIEEWSFIIFSFFLFLFASNPLIHSLTFKKHTKNQVSSSFHRSTDWSSLGVTYSHRKPCITKTH